MRVIAGTARGRTLRAPDSRQTRPTADKIKGAIFSMLEAEAFRRGYEPEPGDEDRAGRFAAAVAWPRVLELYAGSGALAIEALSRGAVRADLVEPQAAARRTIAENLDRTELSDRAKVHSLTSTAALATLAGPYDLLLLDPPYAESHGAAEAAPVPTLLEALAARGLASPGAVLVWEHPRLLTPDETIGQWRHRKTNTHGSTSVSLYTLGSVSAPTA